MSTTQSEPVPADQVPEATVLIIFGASGDLTRRKLMPALYHLARDGLLPIDFSILGVGRRIQVGDEFADHMKMRVIQYCSHKMESRYWDPIASRMESIRADYKETSTFVQIRQHIEKREAEWKRKANKLFYFATNPSHFEHLIQSLAEQNLNREYNGIWSRVIVEKPFGLDFESAVDLNNKIMEHFKEEQIYRIDHFLGKEAVQNILVFRMSNVLFQPLWNREYIDHIQISSSETIGVEGRVDFFEQTGAVRDMIQSHLLQILAFLTMDHPRSLDPEHIRDEKVILLKSIRRYDTEDVDKFAVRGQYSQGVVNSEFVPPYRQEEGVPPNSLVETYAAVKFFIDNYRWRGVPFYLRSGKRMSDRKTEIFIQLKQLEVEQIPTTLNKQPPIPNTIRLEIQPQAGIDVTIGWKPAGLLSDVEPTSLNIGGEARIKEPKAYERLILDAMRGDSTLFIRFDEIREMWQIVDPIVKRWRELNDRIYNGNLTDPFPNYPAGTQGPRIAQEFINKDNREWSKI